MSPRNLFIGTLAVSLLNGFVSPMTKLVFLLAPVWLPSFLPMTLEVLYHGAVLFVAVGTLLLAGVPAALSERFRGKQASDLASMLIWMAGALLLTVPGLLSLGG